MIGRLEVLLRRARRWVSRSEWAARLLRLPPSAEPAATPGLLLIQIDGLSQTQFEHALRKGRLPFLAHLLAHEHYRTRTLYSGLPSSTPAFQGEFFYGVKTAVPAFGFMDRPSRRMVRMFEPAAAAGIEGHLERQGRPLFTGGSAYSDVFTGGAAESHFCPSSAGWGPVLRGANPVALAFLILTNFFSFLRLGVLLVVETLLALWDCVAGLIDGHDLGKELKFVPTRVAICILLRELVRIGAEIDVARGLPVVHVNFLGYDEQAHRRGPSSAFAHWALKGIDETIMSVWRAAQRSGRRHYDVWIYSDHGQEESVSYELRYGRTLDEAVAAALHAARAEGPKERPAAFRGIQSQRVRLLGGRKVHKILPTYRYAEPPPDQDFAVAAYGPVGLVYFHHDLAIEDRDAVAQRLAAADVPLVVAALDNHRLRAWTAEGVFHLPEGGERLFGSRHPFLGELVGDVVDLCHHPHAGDLMLFGWRAGVKPHTFAVENGAHGGVGPEETRGFALLPEDSPVADTKAGYLRPVDLHLAAAHLLGRAPAKTARGRARAAASRNLRVMTYNVHSCIGMDGRTSPERIARLIARHAPDVVALQELDVSRMRTGGQDQAQAIAQLLEMAYHFHPSIRLEEELYGDAVLTHLPMRLVKAASLPGLPDKPTIEPRGALWVAVEMDGTEVQIINTHLGLSARERRAQVEALLGPHWLGHPDCRPPVVLCGDFNALPSSVVCRRLRSRLHDAQKGPVGHQPLGTWFGRYPSVRIDHIFVDTGIEVTDIRVPSSHLARVASDHLPLIADLRLPRPATPAPPRPHSAAEVKAPNRSDAAGLSDGATIRHDG